MKKKTEVQKIDLHIHSVISDGTDTPEEILSKVRAAGIGLFSVTDHDAVKACPLIKRKLGEDDPLFLSGVELSCKDELGKYHILGYGYDENARMINDLVETGHRLRIEKLGKRLDLLKSLFGFSFSKEDVDSLYARDNPGKPHLANLMVQYGFAKDKEEAFSSYLSHLHVSSVYVHPAEAVTAILQSGGIPILAHPSYGSGEELIVGEAMEARLKRLIGFGIKGVEAFYSRFSDEMQNEILSLAEKYDLYVTAGSDYHGKNKKVRLGENKLPDAMQGPRGLRRFLEEVPLR